MKHTLTTVRAALKVLGVTIRKQDGEYRVNRKGSPESSAYYTNDLTDALETGKLLSNRIGYIVSE